MSPTSLPRRRSSPDQSRDAALEAARALLVENGPSAVTLKAVAARIGRTHATLLHHFGTAIGLQQALIARMAEEITGTIRAAMLTAPGPPDHAGIVALVFDAFGAGGAGALASWMILTGNRDALHPILRAIHALVDDLVETRPEGGRPIEDQTLQLMLMALGDALLGPAMAGALGLPADRARGLAYDQLVAGRPPIA
ncbi:TetR family transcriptional regulator [Sphingomonas bacterium]|uniref:TetR family transcriptional regulator n=1 Tax=Sphingomonas bacterium TaxID=1895847 RepID=UPI0020C70746|nr:TetR family transcriptional regulator [Sphingomonas bacterium]